MPENVQIVVPMFLKLKPETRVKLREVFCIPQTGSAEVMTDVSGVSHVMCDGTSNKDLSVVTVENMRDYLGQELTGIDETFYTLFDKVIKKIETPVAATEVAAVNKIEEVVVPQVVAEELLHVDQQTPTAGEIVDSTLTQPRTIECPHCKKVIKCKNEKFDARIMLMHTRKYHKDIKS